MGNDRPNHAHGPKYIDFIHLPDLIVREFLDSANLGVAGVIHQNVDSAKTLEGGSNCVLNGFRIRHINWELQRGNQTIHVLDISGRCNNDIT